MAGSPKKSPLFLLLFFLGIAVLSLSATLIHKRYGSPDKIGDTAIRTKLLQNKDKTALLDAFRPTRSNVYSASIFDLKVESPSHFKLPWVELIEKSPNGDFSFTWRVKLLFKAAFKVLTTPNSPKDFSLSLFARDGSPRFVKTDGQVIPAENIVLEPGIYILKVRASGPLDFFSVAFDNADKDQPLAKSTASVESSAIEPLYLTLDARAVDGLERFVKLALQTAKKNIVKTPKGRVNGKISATQAGYLISAGITLSGRTTEHLTGFPSLDVKIKGGVSFKGFSSFKLYKLSTKSGLSDFVFLSAFRDMGFFVPRQELVKLYVNNKFKGVFILMETFSAELFTNQKVLEGDVVGVDSDRMFFDYPYGATLKNRYFHRLKEPGNKKLASKFFLSTDFLGRLDTDHTAKYLSLAALYLMGHGLGVDDLRFYSNPATGTFYPIPRDLNPGLGGSGRSYSSYMTHFAWIADSPIYTIYPRKALLESNFRTLFMNTFTSVADLHYSLASFLSTAEGLSAVNKFLGFFAADKALKLKIKNRLINALSEARKADYSDELVKIQLSSIKANGVNFLGNVFKVHRVAEALRFTGGSESYLWNIRTAEKLDMTLRPSFSSPMAYHISDSEHKNQFVLSFLIEKMIFEILEDAGVFVGPKTYRRLEGEGARWASSGETLPMEAKPYAQTHIPTGKGVEVVKKNIVRHLATLNTDKEKALILFLVHNATEGVSDYRLSFRDAALNLDPVVNKTFIIHPDPGLNLVTVFQVMNNQFLRGERLRVLAFEVPHSKDAVFYTMRMPSGSHVFFPNYMYIPPRGGGKLKAVASAAAQQLPPGIEERADGFYIPAASVLTLERDLIIPSGRSLRIGAGATIKVAKGRSIKVTGSLFIEGTKKSPVRFVSAGPERWGGLYVGGDSTRVVKAELKNVSFDNYGSFPKTQVAELSLNGGITFYNSRVRIEGATFSNAFSEDAVNFISSTIEIDGMRVLKAASDAVDMDFSNAHIKGLHIRESGGDGLDLSVSLVRLEDSTFEHSVDKGLSVGEMSRVIITGSSFTENNMGIANKDQSYVEISGSLFDYNDMAFVEFIKKPTFGRPLSLREDNIYKYNKSDYSWLGYYSY